MHNEFRTVADRRLVRAVRAILNRDDCRIGNGWMAAADHLLAALHGSDRQRPALVAIAKSFMRGCRRS